MLLLQYNWYKMQEYNQNDLLSLSQSLMGNYFRKLSFIYTPEKEDARAVLAGEATTPFLPPPPYAIAHTLLTAWVNEA